MAWAKVNMLKVFPFRHQWKAGTPVPGSVLLFFVHMLSGIPGVEQRVSFQRPVLSW
jgi:hypothetical protein